MLSCPPSPIVVCPSPYSKSPPQTPLLLYHQNSHKPPPAHAHAPTTVHALVVHMCRASNHRPLRSQGCPRSARLARSLAPKSLNPNLPPIPLSHDSHLSPSSAATAPRILQIDLRSPFLH